MRWLKVAAVSDYEIKTEEPQFGKYLASRNSENRFGRMLDDRSKNGRERLGVSRLITICP
jgi:hypothetical protein